MLFYYFLSFSGGYFRSIKLLILKIPWIRECTLVLVVCGTSVLICAALWLVHCVSLYINRARPLATQTPAARSHAQARSPRSAPPPRLCRRPERRRGARGQGQAVCGRFEAELCGWFRTCVWRGQVRHKQAHTVGEQIDMAFMLFNII